MSETDADQAKSTPAETEPGKAEHTPGHPAPRFFEPAMSSFGWLVTAAEVLVAGLLALVSAWAGIALAYNLWLSATTQRAFDVVHPKFDQVMTFFIIIELFRIAVAYAKHEQVLHTVLEAGIVAVARKVIIYDYSTYGLDAAIAYSLMLAALIAGYVLLIRWQKQRGREQTVG
jgi:uncharacterized membrane protein (DUF373 family)